MARAQVVSTMLGLAGLVWLMSVPALAQVTVAERLEEGRPPVVIAHRGAPLGGMPENSLGWINEAIALGADAVHVNVQVTGDGRYVLLHDSTLNRTTDVARVFADGPPGGPTRAARGGKDYVRDYTLDQIRRLTLSDGVDGGLHRVPTLEDALDLTAGRILVILGLAAHETDSLAAAMRVRDTRHVMVFDLFHSATDPSSLLGAAREIGIPAVVSLTGSRDFRADLDRVAAALGPALRMVCTESRGITPDYLDRMSQLGATVCISGWRGTEDSALVYKDDPGPWREALAVGHAAMTDHPEAVLAMVGR